MAEEQPLPSSKQSNNPQQIESNSNTETDIDQNHDSKRTHNESSDDNKSNNNNSFEWNCPSCTFSNQHNGVLCSMCDQYRYNYATIEEKSWNNALLLNKNNLTEIPRWIKCNSCDQWRNIEIPISTIKTWRPPSNYTCSQSEGEFICHQPTRIPSAETHSQYELFVLGIQRCLAQLKIEITHENITQLNNEILNHWSTIPKHTLCMMIPTFDEYINNSKDIVINDILTIWCYKCDRFLHESNQDNTKKIKNLKYDVYGCLQRGYKNKLVHKQETKQRQKKRKENKKKKNKQQNLETLLSLKNENDRFKQSNVRDRSQIESLQQTNEKLMNEKDKILSQNAALQNTLQQMSRKMEECKQENVQHQIDIGKLMEEQKEKDFKINELMKEIKSLKLKILDVRKYLEWETEEILQWILTIENGRYLKYKSILTQSLHEEGVRGIHLKKVNESDVKGWGIKQFDDKKDLTKSIQKLVRQNSGEGASTMYI